MGTIIEVFEPNQEGLQNDFWLALIIALAALGGLIYLLRTPIKQLDHNRRLLIAMLLFFATLIGGGTAFFSALAQKKVGPVTIYTQGIRTPYGELPFSEIKRMNIAANNPQTPFKKEGKRLLVIESERKPHVLSEVNYDIDKIMRTLKNAMEQQEKEK